jgi:cytochrome oxidase Cu insertion factor (SCO1/SenC/PrrC family)
MSYAEYFNELRKAARAIPLQPTDEQIKEMVKLIKKYVDSLPDNLKNLYLIAPNGKIYRRADYPELFEKDPEFRKAFLAMLRS